MNAAVPPDAESHLSHDISFVVRLGTIPHEVAVLASNCEREAGFSITSGYLLPPLPAG